MFFHNKYVFGNALSYKEKLTMMHSSIRHCWQFFCKIIFARSNEIVITSYKESSNNWQFNKLVPFPHVFHGVFQWIHDVEVLTAYLLKKTIDISSKRMIVGVLKPRKKFPTDQFGIFFSNFTFEPWFDYLFFHIKFSQFVKNWKLLEIFWFQTKNSIQNVWH